MSHYSLKGVVHILRNHGRGGGGSLQMITVLHRGGSSQMITVLHRGGPANDYSITWGWCVKSDYVICARPLRAKILIFPAKVCQGVSQFLRCSTPSKVVSLLFCNIVIIRISPNTSTAPKFHNISGYCFRVTGLLCLGILYPCRTSNSR